MRPDVAALSAALGQSVSRETVERLDEYGALLVRWNQHVNLVARTTLPDLWRRHIVDSAQLYMHAPKHAKSWVDIGAGAGLPGLVVACVAEELNADLKVTLIESDARKCAFLSEASRRLSLSARTLNARIEEASPQSAAVVSARALAPLSQLLPLVARHMAPDGVALLPKGRSYRQEVDAALVSWSFSYEIHPSRTSQDSVILKLESPPRV